MKNKFRAWDKKLKVMITDDTTDEELDELLRKDDYNMNSPYGEDEWYPVRDIDVLFFCNNLLEDERFELMQSTGLFDKNGKEIFEGDIIDVGTRIPFLNKIQKDKETGYLKLVPIDKRWTESYFTSFEDKSRFEILGNIYENPELLEVENE